MRLRIEGTLGSPKVVNAETGEELKGVERVEWEGGGVLKSCRLTLSDAAIDVSVDASRVEALTSEDGKYAHTKLLDVARLRWRARA